MSDRRTKRRYAHELYPHADEWQARPLSTEVPYLYARFVGHAVHGTGWFAEIGPESVARTLAFIDSARIALLADALAQGMTGDEAWTWADQRVTDDMEVAWERAIHHGVPIDRIKPYPCGPEPDHHEHLGAVHPRFGWRESIRIDGAESACDACTEPTGGGAA